VDGASHSAEAALTAKPDCIFCQIVSGAAPSFPVYEDERTVTFLDLFPVAPGHALVVPRDHYENLYDTPSHVLEAIAATSKRVAAAIRRELVPDGLGIFQLNGAAAGQTVFHYHMHLLPRRMGDPMSLHSRVRGAPDALETMSARLRSALASEPV
jgi:histidine triad (HIT) family protein